MMYPHRFFRYRIITKRFRCYGCILINCNWRQLFLPYKSLSCWTHAMSKESFYLENKIIIVLYSWLLVHTYIYKCKTQNLNDIDDAESISIIITDFRLSWWFSGNGDSIFGCWHYVNIGCVASVSEEPTISIFRVEDVRQGCVGSVSGVCCHMSSLLHRKWKQEIPVKSYQHTPLPRADTMQKHDQHHKV
jgi:hypothetical protein